MIYRARMSGVVTLLFLSLVTAPVVASPMGKVAAGQVDEITYRHYLEELLYAHDGDDRSLTGAEHDLARDNIAATLSSFGLAVTLEPFNLGPDVYENVVATKSGTLHPDQEYILCAHYDSINELNPELGAPGADDNASGVALVLEVARVLSQHDSDYTIRFIALDAFEGLAAGTAAYIASHGDDTVHGVVNVDMVVHNNGTDSVWVTSLNEGSFMFRNALTEAVVTYGDGVAAEYGTQAVNDALQFENAGWPASTLCEDEPFSNVNVHTAADSLDIPGYVDYGYAARITQTIVGFLVDQAGVQVQLPDADSDADGDVDAHDFAAFEACFTGQDVPVDPPCDFFDLDADGDVDCADWHLFEAVWTESQYPPVFRRCTPALIRPGGDCLGNRCLTVTPPAHGWPMALRVAADPDDPMVSCVSVYVQPDGRLGSTPVFQAFDVWGTLLICDELIVPGTSFGVQCDYGEPDAPLLSTPHWTTTEMWGDTVGDFILGAWTGPNGVVDFNDISSVVDAFRHLPTAPAITQVDLVGASGSECTPDLNIDFLDIGAAVEAFKGRSYWDSTPCVAPCQ